MSLITRYAFVPGAARSRLVADLDRVMTMEKAVVANWVRVRGCETEEAARAFAGALARKRSRFAFPDDFHSFAKRLAERLSQKHDKDTEEGLALRSLREIRVQAAPSWGRNEVELMFWFIRHEHEVGATDGRWDAHLAKWLGLIPPVDRFVRVEGAVVSLDDLTARDYVSSVPLDLDHLTTAAS